MIKLPTGRQPFGLDAGARYRVADLANLPFAVEFPSVASWLGCAPGDLVLDYQPIPMAEMADGLAERWATLERHPRGLARVRRIVRLLDGGAEPFPVFVERGDPMRFVMEGRYRALAFWRLGLAEVPAFIVGVAR